MVPYTSWSSSWKPQAAERSRTVVGHVKCAAAGTREKTLGATVTLRWLVPGRHFDQANMLAPRHTGHGEAERLQCLLLEIANLEMEAGGTNMAIC